MMVNRTNTFFQSNVKSLQSASMILGKFIKAKAIKKTDEEVLAGFGAEISFSEEDSLGQSMKETLKDEKAGQKKSLFAKDAFRMQGKLGAAAKIRGLR